VAHENGPDGDRSTRRSARAVLAVGVLAGLGYAVVTPLVRPAQVGIASDVYYYAARAVLDGGAVYDVTPPDHPGYRYLYPPVVVLAFLPHALAGSEAASLALQTALNAVAGAALAAVLWRALSRRGVPLTWLDGALLLSFSLLSIHAAPTVLMGQVTLWLALALAVGFDALERGRERLAGAAFGAAALVKLFPAAVGAWLLRRRAGRAVGAAVVTGLGGLLAGVLLFGLDLTLTYALEVLPGRFAGETFAGAPDPTRDQATVRRQVAAVLPAGSPLATPLALSLVAAPVAALYRRVDSDRRRLTAILGTLVGTLLVLPLEPLYFALLSYPLVVLLYRLPAGTARRLLVAGTLWTYVLVEFEGVVPVVEALPVGSETALGATRALFAVVTPPTVGMWLLLAGCLAVHYPRDAATAPASAPSD
jgi:hypothetical protein